MRQLIYITVLIVSGVFTSCTDSSEENLELIENGAQLTTGEDQQDPDEEPEL